MPKFGVVKKLFDALLSKLLMIIDGNKIAEAIQQGLKEKIALCTSEGKRSPCLAVVMVGDHAPSRIYVRRKMEACQKVGIRSLFLPLSSTCTQEELLEEINRLNHTPDVDGILVQLPLPKGIDPTLVTHAIDPAKDVDGFHPTNVGRMFLGESSVFFSCTPLGILTLFEHSGVDTCGKHVVVVGRSNIVGKPIAALLLQGRAGGNATVTVAHRYTKNLKDLCLMADILVVAIGKPLFITADMVKEGAVVIDVGINKVEDTSKKSGYKIVGDVDFEKVAPKCSLITPVPGGVGPMTIAMLLQNTWTSYERRKV